MSYSYPCHFLLNVAYLGTPFKSKFTKFTYMLISKSVKYLIYGFKLERQKEYLYTATWSDTIPVNLSFIQCKLSHISVKNDQHSPLISSQLYNCLELMEYNF